MLLPLEITAMLYINFTPKGYVLPIQSLSELILLCFNTLYNLFYRCLNLCEEGRRGKGFSHIN